MGKSIYVIYKHNNPIPLGAANTEADAQELVMDLSLEEAYESFCWHYYVSKLLTYEQCLTLVYDDFESIYFIQVPIY